MAIGLSNAVRTTIFFVLVATIDQLGGLTTVSTQPAQVKFKAIWEPISYPEDVELADVAFANGQVGWIAGGKTSMAGGAILYTKDGGDNWTIQAGDLQSKDRGYRDLNVLDATHVWVIQPTGGPVRMLRTSDGENWQHVSDIRNPTDYTFNSPNEGFYAYGANIFATKDGGRSWKETFTCRTKVQVEGLTRDAQCDHIVLHFPSQKVGYGSGQSSQAKNAAFLLKTMDGGASWNVSVLEDVPPANEIYFTDENTGFLRQERGAKVFMTTNGGKTWIGVLGTAGEKIEFRGSIGWSFLRQSSTLSYSVDGGKRWTTRGFPFPAMPNSFSLASERRGYAVGDHGMIYRYRVVPLDYKAKGLIDAPMMPTPKD